MNPPTKQQAGWILVATELMLMGFFSVLGYAIHLSWVLVIVECGLIFVVLTPIFYILWKEYPSNKGNP